MAKSSVESFHFWKTGETEVSLNPRLEKGLRDRLVGACLGANRSQTLWLKSSGTESYRRGHKMVALSMESILANARAFNHFYDVTPKDCWLNPLPLFHMGGRAIGARCFLAGAREIFLEKWDVQSCMEAMESYEVTRVSLVPAQVFDIVQNNVVAPDSLRMVLVGGGPLDPELYRRSRELGWPLIPSYGMTETAAALAGASLSMLEANDPSLQIFAPLKATYLEGESYGFSGDCLYDGFLWVTDSGESLWEPRPSVFVVNDRLSIRGEVLQVLGRQSDLIKVLGESVNLQELRDKLETVLQGKVAILPVEEERRGFLLHLFVERAQQPLSLEELNDQLLPFERFASMSLLDIMPRTPLLKVDYQQLIQRVPAASAMD